MTSKSPIIGEFDHGRTIDGRFIDGRFIVKLYARRRMRPSDVEPPKNTAQQDGLQLVWHLFST